VSVQEINPVTYLQMTEPGFQPQSYHCPSKFCSHIGYKGGLGRVTIKAELDQKKDACSDRFSVGVLLDPCIKLGPKQLGL